MSRSRRENHDHPLLLVARSPLKTYWADLDRGHQKGPASYAKRKKGGKRYLTARIRRDNKLVAQREINEHD